MLETHAVTPEQAAAAKSEKLLPNRYRKPQTVAGAQWFAEEVRRRLVERFGEDQATEGGLIVHTSLDPALQKTADKVLRAGLLNYDRAHGGWRGPIARIANMSSLRGDWADALRKIERPAGMLADWRLAVVLDDTASSARLGYLEQNDIDTEDNQASIRTGEISLSDLGWAKAAMPNGEVGLTPRRIQDVLRPGDIVMVEPQDAAAADNDRTQLVPPREHARTTGLSPHRLVLRQIPRVEGALVSLDPTTGRVLAMTGGWSAESSRFNRATQAQRQPGSSFKPFVYLTATEDGISPSARFADDAFCLNGWCPNNYEMNFGGPTPLRIALEESLNLVTVRVAQHVGMGAVAKTAISFHLVDAMPRVLPAALGAVETTVLREAGAYASLAMEGREVLPSLIDSVQDRDGQILWKPPSLTTGAGDPTEPPVLADPRVQIADAPSVFQVLKMLEGVVQYGTGVPAGKNLGRPVAGKTGTSQDYNDAWFAGFTPDLVTVVWIGFDTPQTLGDKQTGGELAGPIWRDFMEAALRGRPALDFRVPDGVTLFQWGCGSHVCVDAFKADQTPGAAGVGPRSDVIAADGEVQMVDPDPESSSSAAAPKANSGTGVDTSVGGLY
jgi:penicillin-binding protein 1A